MSLLTAYPPTWHVGGSFERGMRLGCFLNIVRQLLQLPVNAIILGGRISSTTTTAATTAAATTAATAIAAVLRMRRHCLGSHPGEETRPTAQRLWLGSKCRKCVDSSQ
jgi:hypothetical protein